MRSLTLMLAVSGFLDPKSEDSKNITKVTPDTTTRFAFDKSNYDKFTISNESGPQNDGLLDGIDAIALSADEIDVSGYDRALIVRVQSTRGLDSFAVQKMGEAIEAYMDRNGSSEFAAAAIDDLDVGKDLHGKWNTLVLLRDNDGNWTFKNLRFVSVQKSTEDTYAILKDNKMARTPGVTLISTLLDDSKRQALLTDGHQLENGKYHLVRSPIKQGGAFAVVSNGTQIVYDAKMNVIASGRTGFTVMPAIDADGQYVDNKVTTVSGKGDTWDIRRGISATKSDKLAPAYGASA